MDGIIQGAKYELPGINHELNPDGEPPGSIHSALVALKQAILKGSPSDLRLEKCDPDTVRFLTRWLNNNPQPDSPGWLLEDRVAQNESEKETLQLQVRGVDVYKRTVTKYSYSVLLYEIRIGHNRNMVSVRPKVRPLPHPKQTNDQLCRQAWWVNSNSLDLFPYFIGHI